jgi:hypothetical protein
MKTPKVKKPAPVFGSGVKKSLSPFAGRPGLRIPSLPVSVCGPSVILMPSHFGPAHRHAVDAREDDLEIKLPAARLDT